MSIEDEPVFDHTPEDKEVFEGNLSGLIFNSNDEKVLAGDLEEALIGDRYHFLMSLLGEVILPNWDEWFGEEEEIEELEDD